MANPFVDSKPVEVTRWNELRRLVDFAVRKYDRKVGLSLSEIADLKQDGYLAACNASKTHDPAKGALTTWILTRVNGEIRTRLKHLRSSGITGGLVLERLSLEQSAGLDDGEQPDEPGATGPEQLGLADITEDPTQDASERQSALKAANDVLACVDSADAALLSAYYGLYAAPMSLQALGQNLGISAKSVLMRLRRALARALDCLTRRQRAA